MRLIEKMLNHMGEVGLLTALAMKSVISSMGNKSESQLREEQKFLGESYKKANKEFKEKQIEQLLRNFQLGIFTEQELKEATKKVELTDLDVDKYAKKHLSEPQLKEYGKIKEQADYGEDVRMAFQIAKIYVCLMALVVSAPGLIYLGIKKLKNKREEDRLQPSEL